MKAEDERIGFSREEIATAIKENDLDTINEMLDGFGLRKNFPLFLPTSFRAESSILSYGVAFAGRSLVKPEVAKLLIDNLSHNIDVFLFLDSVLYFLGEDVRNEEVHPSQEIIDILEGNGPSDEFGGRVAILEEYEFIALARYLASGKIESISREFNSPIVRYVYAHQMLPLTMLFSYMAAALREPDINPIRATDIIGQILEGLEGTFADSEEDDE